MDGTTQSHLSLYEKKGNFILPRASDYSVVDKAGIIVNLPPPKMVAETCHSMEYYQS